MRVAGPEPLAGLTDNHAASPAATVAVQLRVPPPALAICTDWLGTDASLWPAKSSSVADDCRIGTPALDRSIVTDRGLVVTADEK
ncbi:MAG: hypothetical protein WBE98_12075 [Gammaproteobacteria bacterium]